MRYHHAAALALVGWYLMAPPYFPKSKDFDLDNTAPLSRWRHLNSFDSAVECKAERDRLMDASKSDALQDALQAIGHAALCIASDDPRLKSN